MTASDSSPMPPSQDQDPGSTQAERAAAAGPSANDAAQEASEDTAAQQAASGPESAGPTPPSRAPKWFAKIFRPKQQDEDEEDEDQSETARDQFRLKPVRTGFGLAIGVAIAILLWLVLASLTQLLMWIAVALFIALGLDPIVRYFENRGWPRAAGVGVVIVILLGMAGGFLATLIPALVTQISQLVQRAPKIIDAVTNNPTIQQWDQQFRLVEQAEEQVDKFLRDSSAVGGVFSGVIGAGNLVGQAAFGTLIVLVLAIYFLVSLPGLKAFGYSLVPRSRRKRTRELGDAITRSVGNYVMGQATVALCNALIAFILMTILNVPYPALLALCVAILAFIPLVGGVVAGVLVIIVALFGGGWQSALVYAICYFAYLQVEAYFVSPKIMARAVKVPGAVAVIAVIAGGTLLGVAGALMAIPFAAAVMLLIKEVWVKRQDRH